MQVWSGRADATRVRSGTAGRIFGLPALALALLASIGAPASAHELDGTLRGVHADYFDKGSSATNWQLQSDGRTMPLLPTALPAITPGNAGVTVKEEQGQGGTVVGPVSAASPQATPALGGRKTAVIAFNFASDTRQPWTKAQIGQSIFTASNSTSAFFREESYNQLSLTGKTDPNGDVYGWYTLATPTSGCNYTTWAALAKSAAAADGFSASGYQHVMYVFPSQSSCLWAGLAYLPGTESWINGDLSVRVTAHELGHNMGLHHAGSWDCTGGGQAVTISSSCHLNEYNDPFDVMGSSGSRHSHGWHLQQLGLLQSSNVQTINDPGVYSMTAALDPTTEPTTLRIPRTRSADGSVRDWYYLETRKSGGVFDNFSLNDWVVKGVSIRLNDDPAQLIQSRLLDTHPATGIADAALQPGETFSDGQISVTTLSAGNGAATVQISFQPLPTDGQAPTTPGGLSHVLTGGAVRLQWSASTDNVGVSAYPVYRDGVQVGSTGATSYNDTTVPAGQHVYTVYAEDGAGNRSAASAPHTVTVPAPKGTAATKHPSGDRSGPRVRLVRRRLRGRRLLLAASASDRAGVARLSLWIDGRRVSSRRASRLSYRWRLHAGRHRIVVKAVDRSGNLSTLESRLRVTGRG